MTLHRAMGLGLSLSVAACGGASEPSPDAPLSFSVDFTQNQHGLPEATCARPACRRLLGLIDGSERTIDFAIYGIRAQDHVLRALSAAERRGVRVRGVVDAEDEDCSVFEYPETQALFDVLAPGSVRCDAGPDAGAILHDKFFVFDRRAVWTGSTNLSDTELGGEYNTDVAAVFHSRALAAIYEHELEEMFGGRFHTDKADDTEHVLDGRVFGGGTIVKSYFSPSDHATDNAVLPLIDGATRTLDVAMFFFTNELIADAMLAAAARGVRIRMILDAEGAQNRYSQHPRLCAQGIALKIENWGGKAHAKWAVADAGSPRAATVFGSMNWTAAGDASNDENTLYVKNTEIAARFAAEFEREWADLGGVPECAPIKPEGGDSPGSCGDGVDNDHDGYVDSDDFDCD
jgi:phosphatidylserine/phosphatidylglycerophosphate/cardiolipin synthase-like enzyme